MSIILKAENISKQYRLGTVGTGSIGDDLKRWWYKVQGKEDPFLQVGAVNDRGAKASEDYIWALRDINFEVKKGEVLGIIGKNGAGKSTLLKLLSRVTSPTTGSIKTRGRIASLLEIGTGFHPELTGRENIFMNGAVLGMTKTEIKAKLEEIIAFSGCEMYIDTPVKRYSSGMKVRLGFAVAAHLEPEILVVDEVLAVGDAEFQKKAIGKMNSLSKGEGRTVLFVSHNMASVKRLCTNGIVLQNGTISYAGEISNCIDFYLNQDVNRDYRGYIDFRNNPVGDEKINLLYISLTDNTGRNRTSFTQSEEINVELKFKVIEEINGLRFNLGVRTTNGEDVFVTSSHSITKGGLLKGQKTLSLKIPPLLFNEKRYVLILNAGIPGVESIIDPMELMVIDILSENIRGTDFIEKWPGVIAPKIQWVLNE